VKEPEMRMGHVQRQILHLLREEEQETITVVEITQALSITRGSARSALRSLLRRGLVKRSLERQPGRRGRPGYQWRLAEVETEPEPEAEPEADHG